MDNDKQGTRSPWDLVPRLFDWAIAGLNSVGTVWIFALMIIINWDLTGRAIFNSPLVGVAVIVQFSIVSIVFLQVSHTLRSGRITRNEFIQARFSKQYPRAVCILRAIFNIVGAVMFALLFWQSYPLLTKALRRGEYFGNEFVFTLPTWPTKVLILVGCAALVIQFLRMAFVEFRTAAKNEFSRDEVELKGKS